MSRQVALDNINLKPCDRWGHTEYSLGSQREYWEAKVGIPYDDPGYWRAVREQAEYDFGFHTNDGLIKWNEAGRTTDMGHAVYEADGSDMRAPAQCPFETHGGGLGL